MTADIVAVTCLYLLCRRAELSSTLVTTFDWSSTTRACTTWTWAPVRCPISTESASSSFTSASPTAPDQNTPSTECHFPPRYSDAPSQHLLQLLRRGGSVHVVSIMTWFISETRRSYHILSERSRSRYAVARPSVVCLFRSCALLSRLKFSAIFLRHLVPLPSIDIVENFTDIVPGELLVPGVKRKRGSLSNAVSRKRCKIGGKLVLITNRKSYMRFRLLPK